MKILTFQPPMISERTANLLQTIFKRGGVIAFPSDTAYGLAADPRNSAAVEKIYRMKGRSPKKAIGCIFESIEKAKEWALIGSEQEKIVRMHVPGAFTFILPATDQYPMQGAVGVRIPNSELTRSLSEILHAPYTATSANISKRPSLYTVADVLHEFENSKVLPDVILHGGLLVAGSISTVVDLTGDMPKIRRQGSGNFLAV